MTKSNTILNGITASSVSYINSQESYIAVSTSSTAPTSSDVNLGGTELREAVYSSSTTSSSVTKEMYLDVSQFNGNTINKAGTYSASTGDNLQGSGLTNSLAKTSSIEVFITITTNVSTVNV